MAHEMHDAGLDGRLRKCCVDGIREAFEAFYYPAVVCMQTMRGLDGDKDIFDAAIAQVVHHRERFANTSQREPVWLCILKMI
jgi:hypothetical protein